MFKENDLVMYGKAGVCRVFKIGTPDFAAADGSKREYYFLEPLYHTGTFYAPVEGAQITIRPVISERKAKSLISGIGAMEYDIVTTTSVQQLSQHYQSKMESHKCEDLLSLIKSIFAKEIEAEKNNKKLGQIDKRFLKTAGELVYGELASALGKDQETVEKLVTDKLKDSFK